jgi:hypothetical protein
MISEAEVISFQQLYKKHFGREISREDALKKGIQLLRTVELTYKPMTEEEFNELQARQI